MWMKALLVVALITSSLFRDCLSSTEIPFSERNGKEEKQEEEEENIFLCFY
jgi:hypothetical protein